MLPETYTAGHAAALLKTLFIVGPTASGKSALALKVARQLGGEIICADSQTVRRGMDIGTAKPPLHDQHIVPHHVLDIIDPYDPFTLNDFLRHARAALADIHARKKLAVVVGGTGLYIDALYFQFQLPQLNSVDQPDYSLMSVTELQSSITKKGLSMPLNLQNKRHLINVLKRSGQQGDRREPLPGSRIIGILPDKELLAGRIEQRINEMFARGFVDEVHQLVETYGEPPLSFDAIGYKIVAKYIKGEVTLVAAQEEFALRDRQYAKKQLSWLRRNQYVEWFTSPELAAASILSI